MKVGGINYIIQYKKLKSNTDIYSKIAFDKTTSIFDCELYCDLILDIDINKLKNIIHRNYIRRDNWNLTKKYCELAIEKKISEEYAHEILCQIYIHKKTTFPEDIQFIEEQFELSGIYKKHLIQNISEYFKPIDSNKYKKYLELGSQNNIYSCTNKLGLLCVKENKIDEALGYFNTCLANKFYQAGLNLANYYIELEPNDFEADKYFNLVISEASKYVKKLAAKRYINWLYKKKDYVKAESVLLENFDHIELDELLWMADYYFRVGNYFYGEHYITDAIRIFESKHKKELSIEFIEKKFNELGKKSINLTDMTESLFPIGLWLYREIKLGNKFKELVVNDRIGKSYEIFEKLIKDASQYKKKFNRYKNLLIEYFSQPVVHGETENNSDLEPQPNQITPETVYADKPIGQWFFKLVKLIKHRGDWIHLQFDCTIVYNIIGKELIKKTLGICVICQEDINICDHLIKRQCCGQYLIHPNCMENWRIHCRTNKKTWTCPFCRANLDRDIFGNEIQLY